MTKFQYLCHQRPPVPGAIPTNGLAEIKDPPDGIDSIQVDGQTYNCWGYVIYDRPLSDKEISDYELKFMCTIRAYP